MRWSMAPTRLASLADLLPRWGRYYLPRALRRAWRCLRKREGAGDGGEACEQHNHVTPCRNEIMHPGVQRVVAGAGQHGEPPGEQRGGGRNGEAHPTRSAHVPELA